MLEAGDRRKPTDPRVVLRRSVGSVLALTAIVLAAAKLLRWRRGAPVELPSMTGRVVLVTGGNSGIGRETAAALAGAGATVVLTSRDPRRGEEAATAIRAATGSDRISAMTLDLADRSSIRRFADGFLTRHDRLDVLINNAGIFQSGHTQTVDGVETMMAVNHLGPFLLTNLLLDRLRASAPARIVNVTSLAHRNGAIDPEDPLRIDGPFRGLAVYARSKLASVLFTRELARRLRGTGVSANCCHPGTIRSGFGQDGDARGIFKVLLAIARPVFPSADVGAYAPLYLAASPEVEDVSGAYFDGRRQRRPARQARDDVAARRLWDVSAQLTGLQRARTSTG